MTMDHPSFSPHEFKGDAEMIPKVKVVDHVNDIMLEVSILETICIMHESECRATDSMYKMSISSYISALISCYH